MRETLRSARRSAAIAPPLSTYRNTGWPAGDCPRPPSARGRHKRCASDRRARRSQPRRPASPGRCEHNPNALVHDLNEAAAVALLPPVEPDELRAAKRGRPAQRQQCRVACIDGASRVQACHQLAELLAHQWGSLAPRTLPGLGLAHPLPAPGDRRVLPDRRDGERCDAPPRSRRGRG